MDQDEKGIMNYYLKQLISSMSIAIIFSILVLLFIIMPQINFNEFVQSTITSKFLVFSYACFAILLIFLAHLFYTKNKAIFVSKLDLVLFIFLCFILINR